MLMSIDRPGERHLMSNCTALPYFVAPSQNEIGSSNTQLDGNMQGSNYWSLPDKYSTQVIPCFQPILFGISA
jgi:hypothetical protein